MTDRQLMQQALDAFESVFEGEGEGAEYWTVTGGTYEAVECMQVMRALRDRLAQPESKWKWLTDDDVETIIHSAMREVTNDIDTYKLSAKGVWSALVRAVESKLKEKNA